MAKPEATHDGFVLVYDRTISEDMELTIVKNPDGDEIIMKTDENPRVSLLEHLKCPDNECRNYVNYELTYSEEHPERYIFCIVSIDEEPAMAWADKKGIDLPVNPDECIRVGREIGYHLAESTLLDMNEPPEVIQKGNRFPKLDKSIWEGMHLPYEQHCPYQTIYKRHGASQELLENRVQLRILYQILTEEEELGGAEIMLDKQLGDSSHPLTAVFALHCPDEGVPRLSKEDIYGVSKLCSFWTDKIENIRDYYGEDVGFYFAFLSHYTKSLAPFAVIGTIWFLVQLITGRIQVNIILDLVIVFVAILWSTAMIEFWYRKEWIYNYQWGMLRLAETATPRPEFEGRLELSPVTGEIFEDYISYFGYQCKLCCSLSTVAVCIGIVIVSVVGIFLMRQIHPGNTGWSILVGLVNSLQIQIMNYLYLKLAFFLNSWEAHRLQTEYDNHLAIKKIVFYTVNSFFTLFFVAFVAPYYCKVGVNGAKCTDAEVLKALQIQLGTLFFGVVVTSNVIQLLMPRIMMFISEKMYERKKAQAEAQDSPLLDDTDANGNASERMGIDDAKTQSEELNVTNKKITAETLRDTEAQIDLQPMTPMLDQMAEIVVPYGYVMLFITVFPIMPLLAMMSNFIQMRVDLFNIIHSQRPVPRAANGIGVWKSVIVVFAVVAVFSNLSLLSFRSQGVKNLVGEAWVAFFYFITAIVMCVILIAIRSLIPDTPRTILEAIERQEHCEKYLIVASVKNDMTRLKQERERILSSVGQS